jgi:hypothetical protein
MYDHRRGRGATTVNKCRYQRYFSTILYDFFFYKVSLKGRQLCKKCIKNNIIVYKQCTISIYMLFMKYVQIFNT